MVFVHCKSIAHNKRINTRCARQGQKNVGSLRFAWYCSLRIFARYAGVMLLSDIISKFEIVDYGNKSNCKTRNRFTH